jgi:hypothetical protein
MTIDLIITYREPEPFTELGRMHKIEKYNSPSELFEKTFTDDYVNNRRFQLFYCKYHITVLVNGLKYRYSCYNEYKHNICKDIEILKNT